MNLVRPLCVLVMLAAAAATCASCADSPEVLSVTVQNESASEITGAQLSSHGVFLGLPVLGPGESAQVVYETGDRGENELYLRDADGWNYLVHPYFEGNLRGVVVVTISDVGPPLQGDVNTDTMWNPDSQFDLEQGTPAPW